jgi:hypothetical protein
MPWEAPVEHLLRRLSRYRQATSGKSVTRSHVLGCPGVRDQRDSGEARTVSSEAGAELGLVTAPMEGRDERLVSDQFVIAGKLVCRAGAADMPAIHNLLFSQLRAQPPLPSPSPRSTKAGALRFESFKYAGSPMPSPADQQRGSQ